MERHKVKQNERKSNPSNNQILKEALQTIFYIVGDNSPTIFIDVVSILFTIQFHEVPIVNLECC